MPQKIILLSFLLIFILGCSKNARPSKVESIKIKSNYNDEISTFQSELTSDYLDKNTSPLNEDQMKIFEKKGGHKFFEINTTFRVIADFDTKSIVKNVDFETTTDRVAVYDVYGIAKFNLNGKSYNLNVYQSHRLRGIKEYKYHLFLPFTDLTNGIESYGGGRYIDLKIPEGDKIVIDFNKAYNPYCVYSSKYSCPIPPKENHIDEEIRAGIKYKD